jgi:hypothetical protein
MPKMGVPAQSIESSSALDEGMYKLRLTSINCKFTEKKDSVNMRWEYEILGHQTKDGKAYKTSMFISQKAGWIQNDATHALGLTMEEQPDKSLTIPGEFTGPDAEPEKWQYRGPLLGRECQAYLVRETSNGREYNNIKYYVCAVPNCAQRFPKVAHTKDYTRKK